ncbi:hypothetical protein AAFF27_23425 [Xylophilus sp. GW821-FHT01B05]
MPTEETAASLTLKLRWARQQFMRDTPTLAQAEKRQREQELAALEEALRQAQASESAL